MKPSRNYYNQIADSVHLFLAREGFIASKVTNPYPLTLFTKANEDVLWHVPVESTKRTTAQSLELGVTLNVYSPPLVRKLHGDEASQPWFQHHNYSHIQMPLWNLTGGNLPYSVASDEECELVRAEITEGLKYAGLSFLSRFQTTEDVVNWMVSGGAGVFRGRDKVLYDVAVWRGEIDPLKEPFVPASKRR